MQDDEQAAGELAGRWARVAGSWMVLVSGPVFDAQLSAADRQFLRSAGIEVNEWTTESQAH